MNKIVEEVTARLRERSVMGMSGASGKVPAAIHVYPEALDGGALAYLCDGDVVTVDAEQGVLQVHVEAAVLLARPRAPCEHRNDTLGRALFSGFRSMVNNAGSVASVFGPAMFSESIIAAVASSASANAASLTGGHRRSMEQCP